MKIFIVTERRADFSRFKPIIKIIKKEKKIKYDLVVTGLHLVREHGYTINEIEEMYESDDEDIVGEYNFEIRGMVEAGDSTFECDREDPSVTISYSIELEWLEISVIEWNGDSMWF